MLFIIDSKDKRRQAAEYVARLTSSPVQCVEIRPYKRNRSQAQNRTMWMWYGTLADHLGCEPEDVHEQMKIRVLGVEKKVVAGQALIMPRSTTDLDVDGMSRFMEAIEVLAAELEVTLPMPDDYKYARYGAAA